MERTIFNNPTFHTAIIIILGILLCWNLYSLLISNNLVALIPMFIQTAILALILTKNKNAKKGIGIWAIILIIGPGISIVAKAIKIFLGDPLDEISPLIYQLVLLLSGLVIYHYNKTTVEVKMVEELNRNK